MTGTTKYTKQFYKVDGITWFDICYGGVQFGFKINID